MWDAIVLVGFAAWILLGDRLYFVGDDGAITLRYAERLSEGAGFNYNDGEAVNGASSPLWTLALAAALKLGFTPGMPVSVLGIAAYALGVALAFRTLRIHYGAGSAVVLVGLLCGDRFLFENSMCGLEAPFSMALVAALFHALHSGHRGYIGLVLGLLVANKLDGALAAIAYTVVLLVLRRCFPWREALVATVVAAPLAVVLMTSFGSVIPHSALTKIGEHVTRSGFDPWWMVRFLTGDRVTALAAAATVLLGGIVRLDGRASVSFWTVVVWCASYVAVYSSVDLGDPYPWYLVPPRFMMLVLAAWGVGLFERGMPRWLRRGVSPGYGRGWLAGAGFVFALFLCIERAPGIRDSGLSSGEVPGSEYTNLARQAAGAWLRLNTSGTELLATPWGFPAYEYPGPVYDPAGLNSFVDPERMVEAAYSIHEFPDEPAVTVLGRELFASFRYHPSGHAFGVYARLDSEVARKLILLQPLALGPEDLKALSPRERAVVAATRRRVLAQPLPHLFAEPAPPPAVPASAPCVMTLELIGAAEDDGAARGRALLIRGAPPHRDGLLFLASRTAGAGRRLPGVVPDPDGARELAFTTDDGGGAHIGLPSPGPGYVARPTYAQAALSDDRLLLSNALLLRWRP